MKINFDNWFRRKMDGDDEYMYAFDILPHISFIIQPGWMSIGMGWLFWTLTIDSEDKSIR